MKSQLSACDSDSFQNKKITMDWERDIFDGSQFFSVVWDEIH